MAYYLAIDIGGTNIKYGLIDEAENLIESHEMPTEAEKGGPGILGKTKALVESYLEENTILGVCISSAGMVDPDKGEIFYAGPQIPNYAGTQFKKEIEETYQIPCEIENDVNCAGLAEVMSGNGQGAQVAVCLTVGTGIGGCLLINGEIFHGFSFIFKMAPSKIWLRRQLWLNMLPSSMGILLNNGVVVAYSRKRPKEIPSVWQESIAWSTTWARGLPISVMLSILK